MSNLVIAAQTDKIVLPERISYKVKQGIKDTLWEHGIMPGAYVAALRNEFGTFYQGEGRPIWLLPVDYKTAVTIRPGGIWIPSDKSAKPRIYSIYESGICTSESLEKYLQSFAQSKGGCVIPTPYGGTVGAIIGSADVDKIYLFDESPDIDFNKKLVAAIAAKR
ncbi:MAG: hypothetical protein Q7V20_04820 [Aquabacterium sp.]|nr:hypothetical protein [Aquabacterium sp.]